PLMAGTLNLRENAGDDLKAVKSVAHTVCHRTLIEDYALTDLLGWSKERVKIETGDVAVWKDGLRGRAPLSPRKKLDAARSIISGAVAAWAEVTAIPDDSARETAYEKLKKNLLEILPQSREEGTRASSPVPEDTTQKFSDDLTSFLLN